MMKMEAGIPSWFEWAS